MKNFLKDNWFKVSIVIILFIAVVGMLIIYNGKRQNTALLQTSPSPTVEATNNQPTTQNTPSPSTQIASGNSNGKTEIKPAVQPAYTPAPNPIQTAIVAPTATPNTTPASTPTQLCSNVTAGGLQTPSLILSDTTSSQYLLDGFSGTAQSDASYNFTANDGGPIDELKFTITGAGGNNDAAGATKICANSVCADAGGGSADIRLSPYVTVPMGGGGVNVNVEVFYVGLGTGTINGSNVTKQKSGVTSVLNLVYVGYLGASGGLNCSIASPVVTLVGSLPSIIVPSNGSSGLILSSESQIGQVMVTANGQNNLKVRTITFNVGSSGFSINPTITNPYLATDASGTPADGISCAVNGKSIICTLGTSYATDFVIPSEQTQTFNLFATVDGTPSSGLRADISSWLTASGFIWDDTSSGGNSSTGLTGSLIHGFPINSWTVYQ